MIATELFGTQQVVGAGMLFLAALFAVAFVLTHRDHHG